MSAQVTQVRIVLSDGSEIAQHGSYAYYIVAEYDDGYADSQAWLGETSTDPDALDLDEARRAGEDLVGGPVDWREPGDADRYAGVVLDGRPQPTYSWEQVSEITGLSMDDLDALSGQLDHDGTDVTESGRVTETALTVLRAHVEDVLVQDRNEPTAMERCQHSIYPYCTRLVPVGQGGRCEEHTADLLSRLR